MIASALIKAISPRIRPGCDAFYPEKTGQKIFIEPGVGVRVLDWGGTRQPILLRAVLVSDVREFDAFAPTLAAHYQA